jgi:hypothetical protein
MAFTRAKLILENLAQLDYSKLHWTYSKLHQNIYLSGWQDSNPQLLLPKQAFYPIKLHPVIASRKLLAITGCS